MEVREEHQDNTRGTRDVLASQTVTQIDSMLPNLRSVHALKFVSHLHCELSAMRSEEVGVQW
jgi:hypothetical protein